jgi:hypothetical protein
LGTPHTLDFMVQFWSNTCFSCEGLDRSPASEIPTSRSARPRIRGTRSPSPTPRTRIRRCSAKSPPASGKKSPAPTPWAAPHPASSSNRGPQLQIPRAPPGPGHRANSRFDGKYSGNSPESVIWPSKPQPISKPCERIPVAPPNGNFGTLNRELFPPNRELNRPNRELGGDLKSKRLGRASAIRRHLSPTPRRSADHRHPASSSTTAVLAALLDAAVIR